MTQQIHARIKRNSKYYGQTEKGELFPVYINPQCGYDYVVEGGPGGRYRLSDVNLFVVENGKQLRIA